MSSSPQAEPSPTPSLEAESNAAAGLLRLRRRALVRGAIALTRSRLRRTPMARIGFGAGLLAALTFGAVAIFIRVTSGPHAPLGGLVETASRSLVWIAAAPVALAAAHDRPSAERDDGIVALVTQRGLPLVSLDGVRALAAMLEVARALAIPLLVLTTLAIGLAGSGTVALARALVLPALTIFVVASAVALGGIASACGRLARRRGRLLFATLIIGPWLLADLFGRSSLSIPGALDALLEFSMNVVLKGTA